MLDQALASRYDFETQTQEDKYGRHLTGRRKEDGLPVTMTVLDPALRIQASDLHAVAVASRRIADGRQPIPLLTLEVGRTEGGNLYLICEAPPVDSLKTLIRTRGPLSPAEALSVGWRIALALREAAAVGVRHLDLSSGNVFVSLAPSLQVRVARFGWSNLLPGYNPARKNEPYHGLPEYLAPEVCAGRPGDEVSDLYSLGILLYEMVAGKPPFLSASPSTTIKRQVYERPLPLHLVRPGMGQMDPYERLVSQLLVKDPKNRIQSAQAVLDQIRALQAEAYAQTDLSIPEPREAAVTILSSLESESVPDASTATAPVAQSRETMVFTGLAEAIEQARAISMTTARAPEPAPEGRPTEAFDPSFVAAAVEAAQRGAGPAASDSAGPVAPASREPSPPAATAGSGTPAPVETPATPAATDQAATQVVEVPAGASVTEIPAGEDWFLQKGGEVESPTTVPPSDTEAAKESRMFWVVAAAVAILLVLAGVIWFESRSPESPEEVAAVEEVVPPPTPAKVPAPAPRVETPAPVPSPRVETPAPAPSPVGTPPPPSASPTSAEAPSPAPSAPRPPSATPASTPTPTTDARAPVARPAPKPAPAPAASPTPRVEPPAPKPTPRAAPVAAPTPTLSPEEREAKAKDLVLKGQQALKDGRYEEAIRRFEEALKVDPNNALAPKLLERARAKAAEGNP